MLYRILIMEKISYILNAHVSMLRFLTVSFLIIICLIEVLLLLRKVLGLSKQTHMQLMLIIIMDKIYFQPLQEIKALLLRKVQYSNSLKKINIVFFWLFREYYTMVGLTIFLLLYARMILAAALWADVYSLNEIQLFYINIPWLILPLLFLSILSLLKDYNIAQLSTLEETTIKLEYSTGVYKIFPQKEMLYDDFNQYVKTCMIHLNVLNIINFIHEIKNTKVYSILQLLIALIFLYCWSLYVYKVAYCYIWINAKLLNAMFLNFLFKLII